MRLKSALLAGFIAGFIWMAMTVLFADAGKAGIVGGGVGFLVGTTIVTYAVQSAIESSHQRT
ncbi:MAG: hypothetical protein ACR2K2_03205 [Mycobacteriales bacterium]